MGVWKEALHRGEQVSSDGKEIAAVTTTIWERCFMSQVVLASVGPESGRLFGPKTQTPSGKQKNKFSPGKLLVRCVWRFSKLDLII